MKKIESTTITEVVRELCMDAAINLPQDAESALKRMIDTETNPLARDILLQCIDNAEIARKKLLPICQDTGVAVFFIEWGNEVHITGESITDAVNKGVSLGYTDAHLRMSIVRDPLYDRTNTKNNTPAIIHIIPVLGDKLTITCLPKGAGSENMSRYTMFKPSAGEKDIIDFVVETVKKANANPCPPILVGVGIGGNFEYCTYLAKKALMRPIGSKHADERYRLLEEKMTNAINETDIGPQGFGGISTAFSVHIETFSCHIASLPVAVNINCHVVRHASITL